MFVAPSFNARLVVGAVSNRRVIRPRPTWHSPSGKHIETINHPSATRTGWFVLSGYKGEKIFYEKVIFFRVAAD